MTAGKPSTTAHVHEYGPRLEGVNHGRPVPEGTGSHQIDFNSDGSVSVKKNIKTRAGANYAEAPAPAAGTAGKYLETW